MRLVGRLFKSNVDFIIGRPTVAYGGGTESTWNSFLSTCHNPTAASLITRLVVDFATLLGIVPAFQERRPVLLDVLRQLVDIDTVEFTFSLAHPPALFPTIPVEVRRAPSIHFDGFLDVLKEARRLPRVFCLRGESSFFHHHSVVRPS
jgi:hypothetical protein